MSVRSFSSFTLNDGRKGKRAVWQKRRIWAKHVHGNINILHGHFSVDLLHCCRSVLHREKGFLINIGRLDRVDLLLEHINLPVSLLKRMLMLLLAL